jgi:hypothetical protein
MSLRLATNGRTLGFCLARSGLYIDACRFGCLTDTLAADHFFISNQLAPVVWVMEDIGRLVSSAHHLVIKVPPA